MPRLISNGRIVEDEWAPADAEDGVHAQRQILTLGQWEALEDKSGSAVQLEPDHACAPLLAHLDEIILVAINFPIFMDGRGFSYARELRERGYRGELRAVGHFIRDQLHYMTRCGFDSFRFEDELLLEEALESLVDFSEHYQASIDEPLPLFRRREEAITSKGH
jgi:uncharacterized protein (DUF934 family)